MGRDRVLLLFFAALLSLLFCAIGLLLRKKDIFSMLNDPRVDKYPKTFQDIRDRYDPVLGIWFLCLVGILCA